MSTGQEESIINRSKTRAPKQDSDLTNHSTPPLFSFDNSFAHECEGLYVPWQPASVSAPQMVRFNRALAITLGLNADRLDGPLGADLFSGNQIPEGAEPLAQAYAGHQFGGFSPQLGDGRALLLGELIDCDGERRDLALKGSGRTPFSRGGDGKAPLGPVLREYLIGEAMHALGIPTTRALAVVTTGEPVYRDGATLPGAVLTRIAASHIRIGTFQYFAARGELTHVRQLARHVMARHYPMLQNQADGYLLLLRAMSERQAALIARWMGVGFIHGVMNTDNMTLSGETIDYGPCAFMDAYDPSTVFSSIDAQGRYRYANQPVIAHWNIARFAEALLPLLHTDAETARFLATEVVDAFPGQYQRHWLALMRRKLGLCTTESDDLALVEDFLATLEGQQVDFTLAFRYLAQAVLGNEAPLRSLWREPTAIAAWLTRWQARIARDSVAPSEHAALQNQVNPAYIPRNHQVEMALAAAVEQGDLNPFERLLAVLLRPFEEQPGADAYALPATPAQAAGYCTFCGT